MTDLMSADITSPLWWIRFRQLVELVRFSVSG